MIINLYSEDFSHVEIENLNDGEILGYKLDSDKLMQFAKWCMNRISENELIVLGEKKIASVFDCGGTYIENWNICYDNESNLYKFYHSFGTKYWHAEDFIAARIIECFGGLGVFVTSGDYRINDCTLSDE